MSTYIPFAPVPEWASGYPERATELKQLSLTFYCINCMRKRPTAYVTPNFGAFCEECLKELEPLLKKPVER